MGVTGWDTHEFRVDGHVAIVVVAVLHLLVRHELQGAVRNAKHAGNEALWDVRMRWG